MLTTLELLFTSGGTAWNDQFDFQHVIGQPFTAKIEIRASVLTLVRGEVNGLVRPMRLIDKSLWDINRRLLVCASHNIFFVYIAVCFKKNHEL